MILVFLGPGKGTLEMQPYDDELGISASCCLGSTGKKKKKTRFFGPRANVSEITTVPGLVVWSLEDLIVIWVFFLSWCGTCINKWLEFWFVGRSLGSCFASFPGGATYWPAVLQVFLSGSGGGALKNTGDISDVAGCFPPGHSCGQQLYAAERCVAHASEQALWPFG